MATSTADDRESAVWKARIRVGTDHRPGPAGAGTGSPGYDSRPPTGATTLRADDFTAALQAASAGDASALDRLFPVVYQALRSQAAGYLRGERVGHTLQPTALAHEVYLRLAAHRDFPWQNRAHFMAIAARAMRRILVDHARRKRARKRGGGEAAVTLDTGVAMPARAPVEFDDLDRALADLARLSERQARVVEMRYFGGMSIEETGEVLGISPITVKRDWATARAWLYRELSGSQPGGA